MLRHWWSSGEAIADVLFRGLRRWAYRRLGVD